jgi:hypothetical protein
VTRVGGRGGVGGGGGSSGGSSSSHTPVGQLMPFAFGIVNNQLDILCLDHSGQVFTEAFSFNNFFSPNAADAQFISTDLILNSPTGSDALGYPAIMFNVEPMFNVVPSSGLGLPVITIPLNFMSQAALNEVIVSVQGAIEITQIDML